MKQLREYQEKAIDAIYSRLKSGVKNQMLVLATGCGKTFTAVSGIKPFKKRLWITHTEELLDQSGVAMLQEEFPDINIREMIETYGGLTEYVKYIKRNPLFADMSEAEVMKGVSVIKADLFGTDGDIVLASAQTLHRRLDKIKPDLFDVIVADECHLFGAATFVKSLNYFNPKLLLGLTATPHREDGMLLGDIFDEIVFQYNIGDAVKDGYLCELDAIQVKTKLNLDTVRTTAGEFNQKDLKETVDTPERNKLLVDKYFEYAKGKQNIVFCVDVAHAQHVCEAFREAGEIAEVLVGDEEITPDRKKIIKGFKNGSITHLINVMIATAGFDHPGIGCVTMGCPTKSVTKFMQQLGRGTRTLPGVIDKEQAVEGRMFAIKNSAKPKCIVLDIVDTTSRHRLINTFELDRGKPIEDRIFVTREKKIKLLEERQRREFEARSQKDKRVDLLQLPKAKISNSISMKDPATEKQLALIARFGYDIINDSYTKAMASEIISNQPATERQIKFLKWKGYDVSNGVTAGEAQMAFEEIKQRELQEKMQKESAAGPINDVF